MLSRFEGDDGHRRLIETLRRPIVVNGDEQLAEVLFRSSDLAEFAAGDVLISDGSIESDVFFILTGRVAVEIRGLEVAVRPAGTHVGEMAALDPTARRSAADLPPIFGPLMMRVQPGPSAV